MSNTLTIWNRNYAFLLPLKIIWFFLLIPSWSWWVLQSHPYSLPVLLYIKVLGIYYSSSIEMFLVSCIVQNTSISAQIISCSLETLLSICFFLLLEIQRLDFILFSSLFFFFQYILFSELGLEISKISQVMVTLSHDHVPWWKMVEGSRRNSIISCMLWDTWTLTILFFFYFSDFVLIFFFFSFLFLLDDEEAHDTVVTWQVTWCDIIGLEHDERIWKMISGHMYTT